MTSASDEKWRTFNCFFHSGGAKDVSAPLIMQFYGISFIHPYKQYQANPAIDQTAYTDARKKIP